MISSDPSAFSSAPDFAYKIVLAGDAGVGKTHLLRSFLSARTDDIASTIGVEFRTAIVLAEDGTRIQAHIWDTAGQERYHSIVKAHYRNAAGVMLVYDVNDPQSLTHAVDHWLEEAKAHTTEGNVARMLEGTMLLGNKCDLPERISKTQEAIAADKAGVKMMARASAKTGEGVREAFVQLLRHIHSQHNPPVEQPSSAAGFELPSVAVQQFRSACC